MAALELIRTLLFAVMLAVLARFLPWPVFMIVAAGAIGTAVYVLDRRRRARYQAIADSARTNRIEGFPILASPRGRSMDDVMIESLKDLAAELEKKCYQLVEKNIQLLSLKEISLTIISSLNESRIVDSVHGFLSQGLGFKEIFIVIFSPEIEAFRVYTFRETVN